VAGCHVLCGADCVPLGQNKPICLGFQFEGLRMPRTRAESCTRTLERRMPPASYRFVLNTVYLHAMGGVT
jgi:hypothetical protein